MKLSRFKKMSAVLLTVACTAAVSTAAYADGPSGPASDTEITSTVNTPAGPGSEASSGQATEGQTAAEQQPDTPADQGAQEGQDQAGQLPEQTADGLVLRGGRYIDPNAPMVALTFDDGPFASVDNAIMDTLEHYNGRGTFFLVGNRVPSYQDTVKRMHDNGHEIGNHTYQHKYLDKLGSTAEIRSQIDRCNDAVAAVTGEAPKLVRLPGGRKNSTVMSAIQEPMIMWNIDTLDWKTKNAANTVQVVLSQVKDGDIVLMHELYTASGQAVEAFVPELAARGFQMVTVSELAEFRGGAAGGKIYNSFRR